MANKKVFPFLSLSYRKAHILNYDLLNEEIPTHMTKANDAVLNFSTNSQSTLLFKRASGKGREILIPKLNSIINTLSVLHGNGKSNQRRYSRSRNLQAVFLKKMSTLSPFLRYQ